MEDSGGYPPPLKCWLIVAYLTSGGYFAILNKKSFFNYDNSIGCGPSNKMAEVYMNVDMSNNAKPE